MSYNPIHDKDDKDKPLTGIIWYSELRVDCKTIFISYWSLIQLYYL
jgi:hypothetical protein